MMMMNNGDDDERHPGVHLILVVELAVFEPSTFLTGSRAHSLIKSVKLEYGIIFSKYIPGACFRTIEVTLFALKKFRE